MHNVISSPPPPPPPRRPPVACVRASCHLQITGRSPAAELRTSTFTFSHDLKSLPHQYHQLRRLFLVCLVVFLIWWYYWWLITQPKCLLCCDPGNNLSSLMAARVRLSRSRPRWLTSLCVFSQPSCRQWPVSSTRERGSWEEVRWAGWTAAGWSAYREGKLAQLAFYTNSASNGKKRKKRKHPSGASGLTDLNWRKFSAETLLPVFYVVDFFFWKPVHF